ncbi:hypothetical protein [Halostreptopolyspora alba]|uniref:TPM domain-containing protein n=1 Tax=Halostreptopolyspora alba TaxID=2487137 RepID=A0A3N0E394_9ACTN|nr:hypothetical protein EFW17_19555 [Nocardiopsaceae bacterium YIM 96095]
MRFFPPLLGLVLIVLAGGTTTAPEAAADADTGTRAERYARQLAEDPVYVSDHYAEDDLDAVHQEITDAVSALEVPVYVLVVPTSHASDAVPDQTALIAAVRERLGEDGLYLAANETSVAGETYGVQVPELYEAVEEASGHSLSEDLSPAGSVARVADNIASGEASERYEERYGGHQLVWKVREMFWGHGSWGPFTGMAIYFDPTRPTTRPNFVFAVAFLLGAGCLGGVLIRRDNRRFPG